MAAPRYGVSKRWLQKQANAQPALVERQPWTRGRAGFRFVFNPARLAIFMARSCLADRIAPEAVAQRFSVAVEPLQGATPAALGVLCARLPLPDRPTPTYAQALDAHGGGRPCCDMNSNPAPSR
jgi:hypothetical protein